MKIIGIIQARVGSSRRPDKIFADINGKPLIEILITRMRAVKKIKKLIIATTEEKEDDQLEEWSIRNNISCFRGSKENVLSRFYYCAIKHQADIVVRITGDDPLKDPFVTNHAIELLLKDDNLDYVSNTIKPSYPEGIDIEVFRFNALKKAFNLATKESDLEHVTPFIWRNKNIFKSLNFTDKEDFSNLRLTVDYEEDLIVISAIMKKFKNQPLISYNNVINFLIKSPEITSINSNIIRNEGYIKSIKLEEKNE